VNRNEDPSALREAFAYQRAKGSRVFLFHEGRYVKTLTGPEAATFLSRIEAADRRQAQLLMARATRNFKRGNERSGKRRGR
jgi:hypothetical protein